MTFLRSRHHRLARAVFLALLVAGCRENGLKEASANFDLPDVRPFLLTMSRDLGGIDSIAIEDLVRRISTLPIDSQLTQTYQITFRQEALPLRLEAVMDDVNAPDLAFWAPSPLIEHIDSLLQRFLDTNKR